MGRHKETPGTPPSRRTGPLALTVRDQTPNDQSCYQCIAIPKRGERR